MTVFADRIFPVPMGIAVEEHYDEAGKYTGCKVYVGNSPNLLVLEDTDGDDKADARYPLLTGFGGIDSDHGVHGMVLGLDGKLYFTHGDGCCSVQPEGGQQTQNFDVVDESGRHVTTDQLANTLRVNRDGTEFEILADRQRNNYETSLNAFGNIFTSDNDDDGNRGCRVIWVMDGGTYGYRTPGSPRHWGEDVPGNVPKLVGTGNGSPCGIMVYEGSLPARRLRLGPRGRRRDPPDQLVPADPRGRRLPDRLRGAPVQRRPLVPPGRHDRRPRRLALRRRLVRRRRRRPRLPRPDDRPDLPGHRRRGRSPSRPTPDFGTVDGLIAALKSPNVATQDAARRGLLAKGVDGRRSRSSDSSRMASRSSGPAPSGSSTTSAATTSRRRWRVEAGARGLRDEDPRLREHGRPDPRPRRQPRRERRVRRGRPGEGPDRGRQPRRPPADGRRPRRRRPPRADPGPPLPADRAGRRRPEDPGRILGRPRPLVPRGPRPGAPRPRAGVPGRPLRRRRSTARSTWRRPAPRPRSPCRRTSRSTATRRSSRPTTSCRRPTR